MGTTINPAVRRVSLQTWGIWTSVFGASVGVGVIAVAVPLRLLVGTTAHTLPQPISHLVVLMVATSLIGLAVVRELGFRAPVPYRNAQVPEAWRRVLPGLAVSAAFGAQLGVGFATRYFTSLHIVMVAALVAVTPFSALLLGGMGYGLGRSLVIVAAVGAPRTDADPTDWLHARFAPQPRAIVGMHRAAAALSVIAGWSLFIR